jgi:probable F420-dependent oxidoreductase
MSGPRLEIALLADPAGAAEAARAIEAQGFDGTFSFEAAHDPFLPLALAAGATERLELGTAIAVAFARNPMLCAQLAQDLQRIAGGRFWLGLGSQIRPHIERRFSQPWSRPAARMHEFVRAIRAIWHSWTTGEKLDFRGEFYTHTLMTPFFDPGPNPFGDPPIYLAAVGARMLEVAGEVADGLLVHPLHTAAYLEHDLEPALARGTERAGRAPGDVAISCQTITMIGGSDAEIATARQKARGQISFYGSTPAYKGVLERSGWGDLQPRLNQLSKRGQWQEMMALIDDDMLDAIGVSGTPVEAGRRLRARNARFERTSLILYNETDPEAVVDLLRSFREGRAG